MNSFPVCTAQASADTSTCIKLHTGRLDCHVEFYPQQYQLLLKHASHEEKIDLGYAGSRLLERLIQTPGEVVSREQLLAYAWSERVVGQGSLNQQIYMLRHLLGDEKKREIIQTLPRRGYFFNPQSLAYNLSEPALESLPNTPVPSPRTPAKTTSRKHVNSVLLGVNLVLTLALLTMGYQAFLPNAQASDQQGPLFIHYSADSRAQLEALQDKTAHLSERLNQLAKAEGHIYLAQADDYLELQCVDSNNTQRWLKIHSHELNNAPDLLLKSCFE